MFHAPKRGICVKRWHFKGAVHLKYIYKIKTILLPVVLFINVVCFGVSCLVLEADFCLFSNAMGVNGAFNVEPKEIHLEK